MKLFNSLTQLKEEYTSPTGKMYVCGITPYDITHLGHAFTYVFFDTLARYLKHLGKTVTYVQNITDIDDDILKKAKETGKDWKALGNENARLFWEDNARLNNLRPDLITKATEHISDMNEINTNLVKKGFAYTKEGNVYFEVSKWDELGKLSRVKKEDMLPLANERGNKPEDSNKRDPLDFLLWQAKKENEPAWASSFGEGRPGWHIECSAMALKHLGPTLDIHGGGHDLIFPHHEAEIAQSEAHTGKQFARFWLHIGMVGYQGEKMSKSLGNMIFVRELLKHHSPNAIRLLLLSHHYREEWEYSEEDMKQAAGLAAQLHLGGEKSVNPEALKARFFSAMDDDMNTPYAIEAMLNLSRGNAQEDANTLLLEMATLLGLVIENGRIAA